MARIYRILALVGAPLALGACTTITPAAEVTRFHNGAESPIIRGSIVIGSLVEEGNRIQLEQGIYEAAVMRELQRAGYSNADTENSDYVARVAIVQNDIAAPPKRSPVSVGVGGSTGSYGSGLGLGIGINLGGGPKAKIATELSVRITRQSDGKSIWEGRSSIEVKEGSPAAQPGLAAGKLAEALFKDFPGESGTTIRVP